MTHRNLTPKVFATLALAAVGVIATAGVAAASNLSAHDIKKLIDGRKVYLSTPLGIELPLHYRRDGSVTGDVSGISAASMFAPKETGRWWVSEDRLCQKWPTWYDGKQFCFTIEPAGEGRIEWHRDDGYSGTARIAAD